MLRPYCRDVSHSALPRPDSFSIDFHPLCPRRDQSAYVTGPMPNPCTVTQADPVQPELPRPRMLRLPPCSPAVITTHRVPHEPCLIRHLTDVSDSLAIHDSHPPASPLVPVRCESPIPGLTHAPSHKPMLCLTRRGPDCPPSALPDGCLDLQVPTGTSVMF